MFRQPLTQISAILWLCVATGLAEQVCIVEDNATFTFASQECVAADGARVQITPSPRARRFLHIREAGQAFLIGRIAPGQKEISLGENSGALSIDLKSAPERDWPRPGVFVVTERRMGTWKWPVTAEQIAAPILILLLEGTYDVELLVEGHKPRTLKGLEIKSKHKRTEHIQLDPVQRLMARVVGPDGATVPFPQVLADCRDPICEGNATGEVKCELPEALDSLCVERSSVGRRRIVLDRTVRDISIPRLELLRGVTLVVRVPDDQQFPDNTKARLVRQSSDARVRTFEDRALEGSLLLFEDLEPADYALLVSGPEPLQRLAIPFNISESDTEQQMEVSVRPYRLTGLVTLGGKPVPQASVELGARLWRARLRADEEGRFSAAAWEECSCSVIVSGNGLSTPYGTMKSISDTNPHIEIEIPKRRIAGRVLDAEENIGVASARVDVEIVSGDVRQSRVVTADANGNYEFAGADVGSYVLRAASSRHLPADPVRVDLKSSDDTRYIDIRLTRGVLTDAIVLDSAGRPAGNALLFPIRSDQRVRVFTTRADGRVSLPLPRQSPETIFVLTNDGSLGVFGIRVKEQADLEPIALAIPPAVATVLVKARSESGKALAGLWLNAKLNGHMIPAAVLRRFADAQHAALVTNASGEILLSRLPIGVLEIALTTAGPQDRPPQWARVELGTGTTVVEQTFAE